MTAVALAFPDDDPERRHLELLSGQSSSDAHTAAAAGGPTPPAPATRLATSNDHPPVLADPNVPTPAMADPLPSSPAPGSAPSDQPATARRSPTPILLSPWLPDPFLALAADVLDDLESVRIANENRLRQLTRTEEDSDGQERGFGLTLDHPDVARLAALVAELAKAEHQAALNLARLVRKHPLGPWIKEQRGVGEKQGARLLAAVGDPYWNTLHDRPRTVSELWAYAGLHVLPAGQRSSDAHWGLASGGQGGGHFDQGVGDNHVVTVGVAATRARGQKANWSATAKMRAYLVAVSCMKTTGPYRDVYEQARERYADTVHPVDCRRCGPAGKPALAGSPRSAGHQHAMAVRLVAKTVLRDLWREAKRLHELADPTN